MNVLMHRVKHFVAGCYRDHARFRWRAQADWAGDENDPVSRLQRDLNQPGKVNTPERYLDSQVRFHKLGDDPKKDRVAGCRGRILGGGVVLKLYPRPASFGCGQRLRMFRPRPYSRLAGILPSTPPS